MSSQWSDIPGTPARAYRFVVRQPSWVARIALTAAMLVLLAVLVVVIVPALVIGAVVFLALTAVVRVKAWFGGLRSPNGALDGRKNVRVIVRE